MSDGQWISVKDRMPELNTYIILLETGSLTPIVGYVEARLCRGKIKDYVWYESCSCGGSGKDIPFHQGNVLYWMPIPPLLYKF